MVLRIGAIGDTGRPGIPGMHFFLRQVICTHTLYTIEMYCYCWNIV